MGWPSAPVIDKKDVVKKMKLQFGQSSIDVCINTYNRFPYLQKCIWSILASTTIPFRIFVYDDQSTDGTVDWIKEMIGRGLIHKLIQKPIKLGSANSLNEVINSSNTPWFAFANDDMWFHRWWDLLSIQLAMKHSDCGMISLYNYTALKIGKNSKQVNGHLKVGSTGLGAALCYRPSFKKAGGFKLRTNKKMGFFANKFCNTFSRINGKRNGIYHHIPYLVTNMDLPKCNLNERDYCTKTGYIEYRKREKL